MNLLLILIEQFIQDDYPKERRLPPLRIPGVYYWQYPDSYQPSGHLNFTHVDNFDFTFESKEPL